MKRFLIAAAVALATTPVLATDVGVSISVGEPGFYGHIDIGRFPAPVLVYPEPVVIQPVPVGVVHRPIYLRVPPGHAKHWRKYCGRYRACGQPVYFVQDRWYNEVYVPRHRDGRHERDRDRRDYDRDDRRGKGHDKGYDKDRGKGRKHD